MKKIAKFEKVSYNQFKNDFMDSFPQYNEKEVKEYMDSVVMTIVKKYHLSEIESYKAVKQSFLYDSLINFPEETLHDDIETNADFVYQDYTAEKLQRM